MATESPLTLADVEAAIDQEAKRLSHAETTLALNPDDHDAEAVRVDSLEKLDVLDSNRRSLQRIAAKRKESAREKAAQARAAADRETAESIPECISNDQRRVFKDKIMRGLELLAEGVPEFEALQHQNQRAILSLRAPNRGNIEPLMKAARNVSLTLQIRDVMKALHGTRLLLPCVEFKVPSPPTRQPMKGQRHEEAAAIADAFLARTVDDSFDECVERVQGHLNVLLGPPVETVEGAGAPWHGRSDAERPDSFEKQLAAGNLAFDDGGQKERQAQRVKDSAAPVDPSGVDLT